MSISTDRILSLEAVECSQSQTIRDLTNQLAQVTEHNEKLISDNSRLISENTFYENQAVESDRAFNSISEEAKLIIKSNDSSNSQINELSQQYKTMKSNVQELMDENRGLKTISTQFENSKLEATENQANLEMTKKSLAEKVKSIQEMNIQITELNKR